MQKVQKNKNLQNKLYFNCLRGFFLLSKIYFLITNPQKRSLLLKSIQQQNQPQIMIKKENSLQSQRKNKNQIKNKFVEEQTGSDTPKKICFKTKFIQWLKQLPLDQRYLALKVYAPGLSKKIQETLIDLQNGHIQQVKRDPQISKKISLKHSKQIIQSIVLISDGQQFFDNIGFDFAYIEYPDRLYQLLTLTMSQSEKQMYMTDQYEIQAAQLKDAILEVQKCQSKQQLALIIINFLRTEIFTKFQQKKSLNLEEERNRKKQFSVFWRNLSQQFKRKILMLFKQDTNALSKYLAEKQIFINSEELQKQVGQLIELEKNQFCNKIFKCKLKRSLTYFTDYYELVYKIWKNQLNKKKRKQRHQRNFNAEKPQNAVNRNSSHQVIQKIVKRSNKVEVETENGQNKIVLNQKSSKNITLTNQKNITGTNNNSNTTYINGEQTLKRKRKRNHNRRKKSVSAQSKQTKATSYKYNEEEILKQQQGQNEDMQISNEMLQTNLKLKSLQNNPQTPRAQIKIPPIDYHTQIYDKVAADIQQYSDLINEEANQFYQRRVIAYERIQFMLSLWKVPIKLFGSCASGITIKNSDIDIAIDNTILNYFQHLSQNYRLKGALEQLQVFLAQQPWVTNLKLIKTAAIPLIKMTVDTSINFVDLPGLQLYPEYLENMNREHFSSGQIQIDLTIETINKQLQCNHLGIISTAQINDWLKNIKPLHSLVIMIKNYFTKTNLNITYEGGLNTYSMICMIVAFLKDQKLQEQTQVAKVLQKLVKFYAYEFDQKMKGIDLLNEKQIFYDKIKLSTTKSAIISSQDLQLPQLNFSKSVTQCQAQLQIKDPLNNGKIMTRNCYSFPKIKDVFRVIHETCFIGAQKELEHNFTQQFQQKIKQIVENSSEQQITDKAKQLLKQCKDKLCNSFLTLFE